MNKRPATNIDKPTVKLIGNDGNAYAILGACRKAARDAGWTEGQWEAIQKEMTAGDYDHLLGVALKHFDVR